MHANCRRLPYHSFHFSGVERCVKFLKRYAEEFGIPHQSALRGKIICHQLTFQLISQWKEFTPIVASCCAEKRDVWLTEITVFRNIWWHCNMSATFKSDLSSCLPHLKVISVRADACWKCEQHRKEVARAVTEFEGEKSDSLGTFTAHLQVV